MNALISLAKKAVDGSDKPAVALAVRRRGNILVRLATMGLTGLLAALTTSVTVAWVSESRRTECANHLRRLGIGLLDYEQAHGYLPPPSLTHDGGTPLLSWRVAILPYLGYGSLYERFHLSEPWDSPHNRALLAEMPAEFACPGGPRRRAGRTGYLVVVGPRSDTYSVNTPFDPTRGVDIREITDGPSSTILIVETGALVPWTKPDDLHWARGEPLPQLASPHHGGAHVAFADGAIRFLKPDTITPQILEAILTINGGEVISGRG
jgi:hypothetical protein